MKTAFRIRRVVAWAVALCAAAVLSIHAASFVKPFSGSSGRFGFHAARGMISVGVGNGRVSPVGTDMWAVATSQGMGAFLLGPESSWRPTTASGTITMGPATRFSPQVKITAVFVPLWVWSVALPIVAVWTFIWSRRRYGPGCCGGCGYDVRGIAGERCPECGRPVSAVARVLKAVVNALRGAGTRRMRPLGGESGAVKPC